MAWSLKVPVGPELGVPAEVVASLKEGGATVPEIAAYIRVGEVAFPAARRLLIVWHVWPSRAAYLAHRGEPQRSAWLINPEPSVISPEISDPETGDVLQAARVLPAFDEVMSRAVEGPIATNADLLTAVKRAIYELSADWPDFAGATIED